MKRSPIPCAQIVPNKTWSQTCVANVTKSNTKIWSNRNYGWSVNWAALTEHCRAMALASMTTSKAHKNTSALLV